MKKILWWSDTPTGFTGFSMVARSLLRFFREEYEIDVLGINYNGDPHNFKKVNIYPAKGNLNKRYNDLLGRQKLLDMLSTGKYDFLWIMHDPFTLETIIDKIKECNEKLESSKKFVSVYYFPVDCSMRKEWVETISKVDFPVAYTYYGKSQCMKYKKSLEQIDVIYHGVDTDIFKPLEKEEIERFKKECFIGPVSLENRYIILNVNRNQTRKDLLRTFEAFNLFKKYICNNALLFLLAAIEDQGGNLVKMADFFDLEYGKDWFAPVNYSASFGYTEEVVNKIYNTANVVISTTLGEGFGLSVLEAMACKRHIIFPRNSSLNEILAGGKMGNLVTPEGQYICYGSIDNGNIRRLVRAEDFAKVMEHVYKNEEKDLKKVERAYKWVKNQTWANKYKDWKKVMNKAEAKLEYIRRIKTCMTIL